MILEESQKRYTGRLKFFDESKKYGFIVMDQDGNDGVAHDLPMIQKIQQIKEDELNIKVRCVDKKGKKNELPYRVNMSQKDVSGDFLCVNEKSQKAERCPIGAYQEELECAAG